MEYLISFLICMFGGFTAGITAFGYAIVCMSFMPLFMEIKASSLVVLISSCALCVIIVYNAVFKLKTKLDLKLIIIPVIGALLGRNVGIFLLENLKQTVLVISLCIFLIAVNIYFIAFSKRVKLNQTKKNALFAGFASGVFGGLFNISGPPLVAYFFAAEENKIKYSAYLQIIFLVSAVYSIIVHISIGNIDSTILSYSAVAIAGVSIGTIAGFNLFQKLDSVKLSKYINIFVFISSITLISKTLINLL